MQIWTIANQKGGVGKTTTTVALGRELARRGKRVLLVDLDPHASLTRAFAIAEDPPPAGTMELFASPPLELARLARESAMAGLSVVAAQPALATLERRSATQPGLGLALSQALARGRNDYDYALLDCPPTLGLLMVNALAAADRLIIPTQTDPLALHGLDSMRRTATMIERSRRQPLPVSILPTLYDRRTRSGVDSLARMRETHDALVWDEQVPVDTRLRDALNLATGPANDAGGRGIDAYARALDWLLATHKALERAA